MDPRISQMILQAVDTRFDQLSRRKPYTVYGHVATVDEVNRRCSVYLSGDPNPSAGFSFAPWERPMAGDRVRVVIDPRGDRYIDKVYSVDGIQYVIPEMAASVPGTEYPVGITMFQSGIAGGYPANFVLVTTFRMTNFRIRQVASSHATGQSWERFYHDNSTPAWSPFFPLGGAIASGFSNVISSTYSLTANVDQVISSHTIDTPASGYFRLWVAHRTIWRHSVATNLTGGASASGGGSWVSFDQMAAGANELRTLAGLGWHDSNGSGGPRATTALLNGTTVTIQQIIRAGHTGTATVYAAAPAYVSNLHSWITRL